MLSYMPVNALVKIGFKDLIWTSCFLALKHADGRSNKVTRKLTCFVSRNNCHIIIDLAV